MTATILKDNVKDVLTRHSGPYRMPFADYLSSSVILVCDSHADFDRLFGLAQMNTCHRHKFSPESGSKAIASGFFWVIVMVVFIFGFVCIDLNAIACGNMRLR
jgi:hypothetical protein